MGDLPQEIISFIQYETGTQHFFMLLYKQVTLPFSGRLKTLLFTIYNIQRITSHGVTVSDFKSHLAGRVVLHLFHFPVKDRK